MVSIWLVRHGESEANAGLVTSDPHTIKLTEKGHEQANRQAQFFRDAPSLIITSPFLRTKQTAHPLVERFAGTNQVEWRIEEFTYLSPARFRNTAIDERRPAAKAYREASDPFYVDGEGAESFSGFMGRVSDFCSQIRRIQDGSVVAFTHEKFMQGVVWSLFTTPTAMNSDTMKAYRQFTDSFSIPNGAFIRLNSTGKEIYFSPIITSHLLVEEDNI